MSTEEPAGGRPGPIARLSVQNWVHLILAGFVLVVCGCLVVGGLVLSRISDRTTDLVDRIQPARSASFQLQNSLLDQETGVRGFALTGDTTFLEPYQEGKRAERERLARVRSLTGNEQPYAEDVDRIERAAQQWRTLRAEPLIAAGERAHSRLIRPDHAEQGGFRLPAGALQHPAEPPGRRA